MDDLSDMCLVFTKNNEAKIDLRGLAFGHVFVPPIWLHERRLFVGTLTLNLYHETEVVGVAGITYHMVSLSHYGNSRMPYMVASAYVDDLLWTHEIDPNTRLSLLKHSLEMGGWDFFVHKFKEIERLPLLAEVDEKIRSMEIQIIIEPPTIIQ